jgi:hypothetical protein
VVNQCESNTFRVSSAQLPPDGATSHRALLTSAVCDGVLAGENFPSLLGLQVDQLSAQVQERKRR